MFFRSAARSHKVSRQRGRLRRARTSRWYVRAGQSRQLRSRQTGILTGAGSLPFAFDSEEIFKCIREVRCTGVLTEKSICVDVSIRSCARRNPSRRLSPLLFDARVQPQTSVFVTRPRRSIKIKAKLRPLVLHPSRKKLNNISHLRGFYFAVSFSSHDHARPQMPASDPNELPEG